MKTSNIAQTSTVNPLTADPNPNPIPVGGFFSDFAEAIDNYAKNLKRNMKRGVWLATVASSLLATSMSHAGDCREVKLKFINKWSANFTNDVVLPVEIRVKKVSVAGNDGTWKEDINNHHIKYGDNYTTNKRRLNRLDSGQTGNFTVEFDYRYGNGWISGAHGPFPIECNDGDTIKFTIMH